MAQMWGGFAVAVLTPEVRQEPLNIRKGQEDFLRRVHRRQPSATVHLNPVRRTLRAVRHAVSGRASEAHQP
jgi:hypothetical protein